jgi:hypothetical protein
MTGQFFLLSSLDGKRNGNGDGNEEDDDEEMSSATYAA